MKRLGTTYIFISHDLAVVSQMCDFVNVMYLGKIVESAPTQELFQNPLHPYTKMLLSALLVPGLKIEKVDVSGEPLAYFLLRRAADSAHDARTPKKHAERDSDHDRGHQRTQSYVPAVLLAAHALTFPSRKKFKYFRRQFNG